MDPNGQTNETPESWEQQSGLSEEISNLSDSTSQLNVNATPFVPNVHAPEFVPSFLKTTQPAPGKLAFSRVI